MLESKHCRWRLRVAYADTDQARIVHHSTYVRYLEIARVEYLREVGFDYDRFEKTSGLALPVVEVRLRYRAPARFDEQLDIETWVSSASRASMTFDGRMRRVGADGKPGAEVLNESQVRVACAHLTEGTIRSIPETLLSAVLIS